MASAAQVVLQFTFILKLSHSSLVLLPSPSHFFTLHRAQKETKSLYLPYEGFTTTQSSYHHLHCPIVLEILHFRAGLSARAPHRCATTLALRSTLSMGLDHFTKGLVNLLNMLLSLFVVNEHPEVLMSIRPTLRTLQLRSWKVKFYIVSSQLCTH